MYFNSQSKSGTIQSQSQGPAPDELDDPEMQAMAQQRLQLRRAKAGAPQTQMPAPQGQAPSGMNAPPPSASTTQMTTQQNGAAHPIGQQQMTTRMQALASLQPGGNAFGNLNTSGAIGMGRGPGNANFGGGQAMPTAPTNATFNPANGGVTPTTITPPPMTTLPGARFGQQPPSLAGHTIGGNDPNDLTDLAGLRMEQQKQMQALKDQEAADRAHAEQNAGAASGLGGFGLSGASATLQSDIGRTQDRTAAQAQGDLASQQATDQFRLVQRQAALNDLEVSEDRDLDGDGKVDGQPVGGAIGDGNTTNNPGTHEPGTDTKNPKDRGAMAARVSEGGTGAPDDPYGGIGGYGDSSQQVIDTLKADGTTFSYERTEYGAINGERYIIAVGSDGKTYKFKVPGSGVGKDMPNDPDGRKWFSANEGSG